MSDLNKLSGMLAALHISTPEQVILQLLRFRDELLRWNRRINLTAITDPDEALEKHLVDSLTLLPFVQNIENLLDLGSGAGFPGIPLKIACPELKVWSVDSNGKKIAFQNHIVRYLGLQGFYSCQVRAENLQEIGELPRFDLIVARAFSGIGNILHLTKPLLATKGLVVAMKGPEGDRELEEAVTDLEIAEMYCARKSSLRLPVSGSARTLLFFGKKGN